MRMADTPNDLFEKEMALVKMWVDGEVEYIDLPPDVQDALTEVFSEEPTEVSEPVIEEQFVKQEAVQHLDLLHKANDEHRFTLGPWYIPNRYDAHGEWTDANELQSALWDYVKSGDRDIRLQHNKDIVAGEWLEAMSFPVPVTIGMKKASTNEQVVYPAGTVFLGVQWKPWAWDMVKEGKIRGFSIGGAAARVEMAMPEDLEKASFGGDRSEAGRYAAYVRWRSKAHSLAQGAANLKAGLDRQQPKGDKPNIAQRIKEYFTTMPTPYRQEEDRLLREQRRANENLVDDTKVEAVSLPSGRTAIMQGGKLISTKFPASGMTASLGRPLRSPKPKTKPSGKRQKQWLESGYGGAPSKKKDVTTVGKSDDSLRFKAIVDAKVSEALKKNSPTSSAVHVDTIMGGSKKKKKKRSKIMVDDVEKASKNVPTNKELYARVKAEAKQKFDVYPSAYANAWLVREYKSRGGKYRVVKASSPAWQREEGKNPKGGLNAKGRASYKRETGGTLKPPVKRGDNPRRASFLARMGNAKGPERDEKGNPTRLLLSLQAWGANSKAEARKKAKAISARNKKKEMEKATFGGNRSDAGRYAANVRWQSTAGQRAETKKVRSYDKTIKANLKKTDIVGRGRKPLPETTAGKALAVDAPSLVTHCNFDKLAEELRRRNLSFDSVQAPEIVLKYLSKEKKAEILNFVAKTVDGVPRNPNGPIAFVKGGGGASGKSSSEGAQVEVPATKNNKEGKPAMAVESNADDYKVVSKGFTKLRDKAIAQAEVEIKSKKITDPVEQENVRQRYFAKLKLAPFVHEESSIVGKLVTSFALKGGKDVIVDGTMDNGIDKRNAELDYMRELGAKEIHGLFYSCDTDTAVKRSEPRARNRGGKDYGRQVPEGALRTAHIKVSKNFPEYVTGGRFDSITLYDTNEKPNRLVAQAGRDEGFEVLNPELYDRFLAKGNESPAEKGGK